MFRYLCISIMWLCISNFFKLISTVLANKLRNYSRVPLLLTSDSFEYGSFEQKILQTFCISLLQACYISYILQLCKANEFYLHALLLNFDETKFMYQQMSWPQQYSNSRICSWKATKLTSPNFEDIFVVMSKILLIRQELNMKARTEADKKDTV